MAKKSILVLTLALILAVSVFSRAFADKVILKTGDTVIGEIIEKTNDYVKLKVNYIVLTFWTEEIESIQTDISIEEKADQKPSALAQTALEKKSFLWLIKDEDSKVYILGSLHYARSSLYPLDKKIEQAFQDSEVIVGELDLNSPQNADAPIIIKKRGLVDEPVFLLLDNSIYQELEKLVKDIGYPNADRIFFMKPWFIAFELTDFYLKKLGYLPEYGIESHFFEKAAQNNKKTLSLETLEEQIDIFESLSAEEQSLFLKYTLQDLKNVNRDMFKITSAWKQGNGKKLDEIIKEELKNNPEFLPVYKKIFFERNIRFASKIETFLKDNKDHLVMIGAGHIPGEQGVIDILEKKGYEVLQP